MERILNFNFRVSNLVRLFGKSHQYLLIISYLYFMCFQVQFLISNVILFQLGKIYELRLMMDFSGSNRGYLFVRYSKPAEAKLAIRELNNYEIRPGKFIGVIPSVDNRKLWISGKQSIYDKGRVIHQLRGLNIDHF